MEAQTTADDSLRFKSLPYKQYTRVISTVGQQVDTDGTRYMVVDCGGGTVDITVHQMTGGNLKEIHKAVGGPFGSIGIDQEFENILSSIFGTEFIDSYKAKRPSGWVDLMTSFEARKRSAHVTKQHPYNVALPFSFIDFHKKIKGNSVESAIKKYGNKEISWSSQGMLRIDAQTMKRLFKPTIDKIKQAIGDVLNHPSTRGVSHLFLVGGFAESDILQHELRREFETLVRLVIPQDVSTTIMKGAVCFGLEPSVVIERVSALTYGVAVLNRFVEGKHPEEKALFKDGVKWCKHVFESFVFADQPVALGDSVVRNYAAAEPGQQNCVVQIYSSEKQQIDYVTDPGVERCGSLCLEFGPQEETKSLKKAEVQATMTFGDTEIKVTAVDIATGRCVRASIDFLGR